MARFTIGLAKRPLLIAGHGIRLSNAQDDLMKVLELGIPVVTTYNGFDLVPNDHSNYVGRIGTVGTYAGNYALSQCDVLICVGTRNSIRQISYTYSSFAPQAYKIIVDIDKNELLKSTVEGELILENAKFFLKDLINLELINLDKKWLPMLKQYEIDHPVKLVGPYKFIHDLTFSLPNDAIVVCGNGTACICMFQAGIVKKGQRIFWNSGCASMGYDLPAAIGACVASGKPVTCITGDGSIMMNLQELQTIKHYNLPIKIYVLDNKGYRSIELTQTNYFNKEFIGCNKESGVSFPDYKKLADVFGVDLTVVDIGNEYVFSPKFTNSLIGG